MKIWYTVYIYLDRYTVYIYISYMTMHPRSYRCIAPTSTSKVKLRFCVLTFQWAAQNGWAKLIGTLGSMPLGVIFRFLLILRNPRNFVDTVWRCLENPWDLFQESWTEIAMVTCFLGRSKRNRALASAALRWKFSFWAGNFQGHED